jgi:hypothetical protein
VADPDSLWSWRRREISTVTVSGAPFLPLLLGSLWRIDGQNAILDGLIAVPGIWTLMKIARLGMQVITRRRITHGTRPSVLSRIDRTTLLESGWSRQGMPRPRVVGVLFRHAHAWS